MGKVDYGDTGIQEILVIDPRGPTEIPLSDLVDNEHIINFTHPTIRVVLAEGEDGKKVHAKEVRLEHHVRGKPLPEGAVKGRKGLRFEISDGLLRGRNDIVVQAGENEEFHFPLFYRTHLTEWIESLLKALILVVVVKTFVVQAFFIPTGSMEDTLFPSDYILVEKVSSLFGRPATGDVIVFQYPEDPTKDFIKRKVADAGDVVAVRDKHFFVNGKCMDEAGFAVHKDTRPFVLPQRDYMPDVRIPEAHSWAQGDNRDNSQDSRFWGPLPDYRLKGRALAIYWPLSRWGLIRPAVGEAHDPGDCADLVRPGAGE